MNYRNAKYIDATRIDCEIETKQYGWIPYTLDPDDTDMTVNNEGLLAAMAEAEDVAAYVYPTDAEIAAALSAEVREERDFYLSSIVDPIVSNPLRWAGFSDSKKAEWTAYRQALLDLPDQSGFPSSVTWPTTPT